MLERFALGAGALTSRPLSRRSCSGPASESTSVGHSETSSSGGGLEPTGGSIFQTKARPRFNLRAGTGLGETVASRTTSFCGRYQEKFSDLLVICVVSHLLLISWRMCSLSRSSYSATLWGWWSRIGSTWGSYTPRGLCCFLVVTSCG
jgi:hypothetical protein